MNIRAIFTRMRAMISGVVTFVVVGVCVCAAAAQPKASQMAEAVSSFTVVDLAGKVHKLTGAEIAKLNRVSVKAKDHGKEAAFEGVSLTEVLKAAGVEFGENLRGKRMTEYLLVEAADKYRAVFALAELDPGFTDKQVIIADRRDGQPLSKDEGPYRLVVVDEKRGARWVRQLSKLTILTSP